MNNLAPAYHGMADAARLVLDAMLDDPATAGALADRKHVDHDDARRALLGQYQILSDYTGSPDVLALIRSDLAAAERRVACLRLILNLDE